MRRRCPQGCSQATRSVVHPSTPSALAVALVCRLNGRRPSRPRPQTGAGLPRQSAHAAGSAARAGELCRGGDRLLMAAGCGRAVVLVSSDIVLPSVVSDRKLATRALSSAPTATADTSKGVHRTAVKFGNIPFLAVGRAGLLRLVDAEADADLHGPALGRYSAGRCSPARKCRRRTAPRPLPVSRRLRGRPQSCRGGSPGVLVVSQQRGIVAKARRRGASSSAPRRRRTAAPSAALSVAQERAHGNIER